MTTITPNYYVGILGRNEAFLFASSHVYAKNGDDCIQVNPQVTAGNIPFVIVGGYGSDVIDFYTSNVGGADYKAGLWIYGDEGADEYGSSVGAGADHILGSIGTDYIFAGGGDDYVNATLGDDDVSGGAGNDFLIGGYGADVVEGGLGNDVIFGGSPTSVARTFLSITTLFDGRNDAGTPPTVYTGIAGPMASNDGSLNRLHGGDGNDRLYGAVGVDILDGGTGNDLLDGGAGNDIVQGGDGADALDGKLGKDTLTGGTGRDSFLFTTGPSASNVDRISDFKVVDDFIKLENSIFRSLGARVDHAEFVANVSGAAVEANDYLIYETDTGELYYDRNGNRAGGSVLVANLSKSLSLTAGDFAMI